MKNFIKIIMSRHVQSLPALCIALCIVSCAVKPSVTEHGIFAPSRLESVIGQDGVCSIPLDDEVTLWTFADTITGSWKSGEDRLSGNKKGAVIDGMISNSIAWSKKISENNYRDIKLDFYKENGKVSEFIKHEKGENPLKHRFWAMDGFRFKDRVYVYYLHVYIPDYRKFLEFDVLSVGLARWDIPAGWKPGDPVMFRRLGTLFGKGTPFFGAAVLERDGYVYLAGHFRKSGTEFPLSIARVEARNVENTEAYSFLSPDGEWVRDVKDAGSFVGDISGECSLSYNGYLKEYVIVYSKAFTGDVAVVRFSDFSRLPFAEKQTVYRVHKEEKSGMWPYSAKEIFSSGRSVFIIYIDPVRYQPVLLEVKF